MLLIKSHINTHTHTHTHTHTKERKRESEKAREGSIIRIDKEKLRKTNALD